MNYDNLNFKAGKIQSLISDRKTLLQREHAIRNSDPSSTSHLKLDGHTSVYPNSYETQTIISVLLSSTVEQIIKVEEEIKAIVDEISETSKGSSSKAQEAPGN